LYKFCLERSSSIDLSSLEASLEVSKGVPTGETREEAVGVAGTEDEWLFFLRMFIGELLPGISSAEFSKIAGLDLLSETFIDFDLPNPLLPKVLEGVEVSQDWLHCNSLRERSKEAMAIGADAKPTSFVGQEEGV
jgi:hypothetical protein